MMAFFRQTGLFPWLVADKSLARQPSIQSGLTLKEKYGMDLIYLQVITNKI